MNWTIGKYTKSDFDKDIEFYFIKGVIGGTSDRTIAEIGCWKDRENTEADVHLIASAPELYEALKEADAEICRLCKRLNPQHSNCHSCNDRQNRYDVLAKANGYCKQEIS